MVSVHGGVADEGGRFIGQAVLGNVEGGGGKVDVEAVKPAVLDEEWDVEEEVEGHMEEEHDKIGFKDAEKEGVSGG